MIRAARRAAMLATSLCLGLSLACVTATAADTVNIGVVSPQKTLGGKSIVNGAKLAAKHINANNGVDGKRWRLIGNMNSTKYEDAQLISRCIWSAITSSWVCELMQEIFKRGDPKCNDPE